MRTSHALVIASATTLCASQASCFAPRRAAVDAPACYELLRAGAPQDWTDWSGFASTIIRLDLEKVMPSAGRDTPTDARAAHWLEWKHTPQAEDAIITALRRLDELE